MDRSSLALVRGDVAHQPATRVADGVPVLSLHAVLEAQAHGAFVLDLRDPDDFAAGHLAGAVNIGLGARFERTCRQILHPGIDIVLVADPGSLQETAGWFAGSGLGRVLGRLDGAALPAETRQRTLRRHGVADSRRSGVQLLDVRDRDEVAAPVPGATRIPLGELLARLGELRPDVPTLVVSGAGYRSSVAASVLRACGFPDVSEMLCPPGADGELSVGPRLRLLASA
jgi:hydroxyacylglutathione hydrolase